MEVLYAKIRVIQLPEIVSTKKEREKKDFIANSIFSLLRLG